MMKGALAALLLLGMSTHAKADNRLAWEITFGASVGVTVAGGTTWWYGREIAIDAQDELCDRGAIIPGRTCAPPTLSADEIRGLNAEIDRGTRLEAIGMGVTLAGAVLTGVATYKLITMKPARADTRPVVAPTVSKDGVGAALAWRW